MFQVFVCFIIAMACVAVAPAAEDWSRSSEVTGLSGDIKAKSIAISKPKTMPTRPASMFVRCGGEIIGKAADTWVVMEELLARQARNPNEQFIPIEAGETEMLKTRLTIIAEKWPVVLTNLYIDSHGRPKNPASGDYFPVIGSSGMDIYLGSGKEMLKAACPYLYEANYRRRLTEEMYNERVRNCERNYPSFESVFEPIKGKFTRQATIVFNACTLTHGLSEDEVKALGKTVFDALGIRSGKVYFNETPGTSGSARLTVGELTGATEWFLERMGRSNVGQVVVKSESKSELAVERTSLSSILLDRF